MKLIVNGESYDIEYQPDAVIVRGTSFKTSLLHDNGEMTVRVNGRPYKVTLKEAGTVLVDGRPFSVETQGRAAVGSRRAAKPTKPSADTSGSGSITALMPGTVVDVRVREGEAVAAGAVLLILEAMKMQNEVKAPQAGTVKRVRVTGGQTVGKGDVMVNLE